MHQRSIICFKPERAQVGTIVLLLLLLAISSLVIMNWRKTNSLERPESTNSTNAIILQEQIKTDLDATQKDATK